MGMDKVGLTTATIFSKRTEINYFTRQGRGLREMCPSCAVRQSRLVNNGITIAPTGIPLLKNK